MRKLFALLIILAFGINSLFANNLKDSTKTSSFKTQIKLSFFVPGIIVEQKVDKNFSALISIFEGFSFTYININGDSFSEFNLYTYFSVEPRYYRIFNTLGAGKINVMKGYFGFPVIYGFNETALLAGPVCGFQRKIGRIGFFNFSIGYGFTKNSGKTTGIPMGNLNLGIVIN